MFVKEKKWVKRLKRKNIVLVDYSNYNGYDLISVICDKMIIIELTKNSKMMFIVDYFLDNNKETIVVAGNFLNLKCAVSNNLINKGATLYEKLEF